MAFLLLAGISLIGMTFVYREWYVSKFEMEVRRIAEEEFGCKIGKIQVLKTEGEDLEIWVTLENGDMARLKKPISW